MRKPKKVVFDVYCYWYLEAEKPKGVPVVVRHRRVVITFRKKDGVFWKSPDLYGRLCGNIVLPYDIPNLEAMTKMSMAEVVEHVIQRYHAWEWAQWEGMRRDGRVTLPVKNDGDRITVGESDFLKNKK